MREGIAFDHVSFSYPDSSNLALDDVSLTLRPGEVVALVGENGSGKTTLIKLLCRLYDPSSGAIKLDGTNLLEYDLVALRHEVIFQDYAHYNMTVWDNVWLGNIEVEPDQKLIEAAARHAGAHDIIGTLERGGDTLLGKWFDRGVELSIG